MVRMRAGASIRRVSKETQEARRQTIFCVYEVNEYGEMAEWLKAHAWKAC